MNPEFAALPAQVIDRIAARQQRVYKLVSDESACASNEVIHLLFRRNAEGLHLPVQIAPLQPEQLRRACNIAARLFEFVQNVFALSRFSYLVKTAESIPWFAVLRSLRVVSRGRWRASMRRCGCKMTIRSIRLRSSRTFPGQ